MESSDRGLILLLSVLFISLGVGYYFGWGLTFLVVGSFLGVVFVLAWRFKEE